MAKRHAASACPPDSFDQASTILSALLEPSICPSTYLGSVPMHSLAVDARFQTVPRPNTTLSNSAIYVPPYASHLLPTLPMLEELTIVGELPRLQVPSRTPGFTAQYVISKCWVQSSGRTTSSVVSMQSGLLVKTSPRKTYNSSSLPKVSTNHARSAKRPFQYDDGADTLLALRTQDAKATRCCVRLSSGRRRTEMV